ncbi:MAG TPA: holo-ACP synthase [Actinomycetota bacterium]|nr:holo-ACP synthase [Actinomycetota bacterium]
MGGVAASDERRLQRSSDAASILLSEMLGVDVVDIERLRAMLERSPSLEARLFTEEERSYCSSMSDPVVHMAGTLAAKEAAMKTLGLGGLHAWARRIEVSRDAEGVPSVRVEDHEGGPPIAVSISHDAGIAVAVALRLPG